MRLHRNSDGSQFRNVTVERDQLANTLRAEARSEAVDKVVELGGILIVSETDLLGRQGLGRQHREPRMIEAKAGIELVGERGKPFHEQLANLLRIAERPRSAGNNAPHDAIGAEQA